jgi:multiphosphoryl transfer protein
MANDYRFTCPLAGGIHARPASAIEHLARRFAADISLLNNRTGQTANAKSVLGVVGLDIRHGDSCRFLAVGRDAAWAVESLRAFVERTLPRADDAPAHAGTKEPGLALPRMLRDAGATVVPGTGAAPGIGIGWAFSPGGFRIPDSVPLAGVDDVEAELRRVEEAFARMLERYDERIGPNGRSVEADVLRAHRSVARDPEFSAAIVHAIRDHRCTAAGAAAEAEAQFTGMLHATGSALLRERALDIRDVCRDLLVEVYGPGLDEVAVLLDRDSVCVADALTPGQFLGLDRRWIRGLVLSHGGTTSHTIVLARAHGIPAVVGTPGLDVAAVLGSEVVADADLGVVVTDLTARARRYYQMERERLDGRRDRVRRFVQRTAATEDGRRIEVAANIGSASEAAPAIESGAEGIGLFRTEMLFLARRDAPGEDEQFEEYRAAVADARGRPVIVRTLDIGGDKPLPYLPLAREDNPFLGYRAVRIYPEFEALFRTQVRALVRASAFGRLQVMIPMVASIDEVRWVRRVFDEERTALASAGVAADPGMRLGAMIEVPSAAFLMGPLSAELDFFSVGTNDLLQYFLAVDRSHPRLGPLANPCEPSFLRLLDQIVSGAHAHGRWVGLCGELGARPRYLPFLVGLGFDEISMGPSDVAPIKALLSSLSAPACRALLERAMSAATPGEVASLLDERGHWRRLPIVDEELVRVDVAAGSKEEAIKAAVDLLFLAGRTDRPREVEEAVWQREADYSTGFGNGFALPHCKTDAMAAHSIAVIRLRDGVEWGALDGQPVRTILLMGVRGSDAGRAHMQVLAALSRGLMHDRFREALEQAPGPAEVVSALATMVEVSPLK